MDINGGTITNVGGRQQIWNLGNNIIDTSNLVNLELQALEMKKSLMQIRNKHSLMRNLFMQV